MKVRDLTLTALFIALGILLPFITGQLQSIGSMLLPMHLLPSSLSQIHLFLSSFSSPFTIHE